MSEKKYSKKHEWIMLDGETATVGISKHATEMLGDIVFVELPEKGKGLEKEEKAATCRKTVAFWQRSRCCYGLGTENSARFELFRL